MNLRSVMAVTMLRLSVTMDSSIRSLLVSPISFLPRWILPIMPRTVEALVPAIMAPKNRASENVKTYGTE